MERDAAGLPVPPDFGIKTFFGMEIVHGQDTTIITVDLGEQHLNPYGVAHGSVPFAMMDTAMGGAAMTTVPDGHGVATIEMHTRFHRPAVSGRLTALATVLNAGRRIVHLEAKTHDEAGQLVASATSSFAVFEIPTER